MRFSSLAGYCLGALLLLLLTACATQHVDWDARVGNYSYDQAEQELGIPKKTKITPDGGRIAEWLVRRGSPRMMGFGAYGGPGAPGIGQSPNPRDDLESPSEFLQLWFGADGKLTAWQYVSRFEY